MFKNFLVLLLVLSAVMITVPHAQAGQAECDPCGYCQSEKPTRWGDCVKCLYDVTDPSSINTREVNDKGEFTSPPIPGHYFTQIGCIKTELIKSPGDVFANPGVVGGIANLILNRLLFPLAGILSLLYLIYGSFLLMTSQDDPQKKAVGKKTVTGAIFGLIFTLLSVFTLSFIAADVLKIPGFFNGSVVVMNATGEPSIENNILVHPRVKIYFNGEVVGEIPAVIGTNNIRDHNVVFKEYRTYTNRKIKPGESFTFNFKDHCPDCWGNPNGDQGDRNLRVKEVFIDNQPCKTLTYKDVTYTPPQVIYVSQSFQVECHL